MRLYPVLRVLTVLCTTSMLLATLAGCTLDIGDAHIRGTIYGDPLLNKLSTPKTPVALAATVRCNGVSAAANAAGKYDLKLPISEQYRCVVSAPPNYVPQSVTLRSADVNLTLDLGPTNLSPSCVQVRTNAQCATLHLKTGSISGKVTYHGGRTPASGALVRCTSAADLAASPPLYILSSLWPKTLVNSLGDFTLSDLDPGLYDCFAVASSGDIQQSKTLVLPGGNASLTFSVCAARCNPVHFHDGPVMHTYTAYLIFWLPKTYTFEPSGDDTRFESTVAQYFKDVGGTRFYGLLTQYWDYHGAVQNSAHLGDVYVDATPYEHCNLPLTTCVPSAASRQAPLTDEDIQAEIERALQANPSWHTDYNSEFFVFTGYNAEECASSGESKVCTFTPGKHGFCGYHDDFTAEAGSTIRTPLIYAYMPDALNTNNQCLWSQDMNGPHRDDLIDDEIDIASHEQFESVSDPLPDQHLTSGWYDDTLAYDGEIGDKCFDDFGSLRPDGSNVTLANGHTYFLQAEWSNRANRCSFS